MAGISQTLFVAAVVCALLVLVAGPGAQKGLWGFRAGFTILQWAAYGGLAACFGAAAAAKRDEARYHSPLLIATAVIGLVTAGIPWSARRSAKSVPPIHDVSTDTKDPPVFRVLLAERKGSPNPAEYGGPEIAKQQEKAYPDIVPLTLSRSQADAFAKALAAVVDMGWTLAAAEASEGRIEATAKTFWFGFKDDVVIRVRAEGTGSRVDARSVSRVGKGDAGANAKRLRKYLRRLR